MNQQIGIPGIVRNGVVARQSNERLPEGTHVEIRLEPGDVPAGHKSEIEAWDKASHESWKCKPTDSFGNSIEERHCCTPIPRHGKSGVARVVRNDHPYQINPRCAAISFRFRWSFVSVGKEQ
jgi:hypothetical protein